MYYFLILWLWWVFVVARGLPLVVASWVTPQPGVRGPPTPWPLWLRSAGSRRASSVVAAGRLSRCSPRALERALSSSKACGIFPDQGRNPGPLHWQAGSHPLCY